MSSSLTTANLRTCWLARALGALAFVVLATGASRAAQAQSVRVTTDMGTFTIQLDPDRAPLTVANFLRYVNEGHYTDTLFHRVVSGFVVQGGGYSATDMKLKPTHESIVNESGNGLQNKRGTVGMARAGAPHSGNSQFYVNVADNPELDPLPTRWGYAVFGRVTDGMDVLDRMAVVATGAMGPFKSEAPLKPIVIQKIEVLRGDGGPSSGPTAVNPSVMPSSQGAPPAGASPSGSIAANPSGASPANAQPANPSGASPASAPPANPAGATNPSGAPPASSPSSGTLPSGAAPK